MKKTKIRSIGTSKGFIIPKDVLEFSGIIEDAVVYNDGEKIIIEKDQTIKLKHGLIVDLQTRGLFVQGNNLTLPNGTVLELNAKQIVQMNKEFKSTYQVTE